MVNSKQQLLKQFSLLLRNRSKSEKNLSTSGGKNEVSPQLAKFYTRKQLIEIISQKFNGSIPKEYNLVEMENEELLQLIGDDMYLIAYSTWAWSKELVESKQDIGNRKQQEFPKPPVKPNSTAEKKKNDGKDK